jgi:low temperature requirement protein LtrA
MKHFRIWWQKPRRYTEQEEERSVTFLELFYDLVYVVIIAELAHSLSTHISIEGFLQYGFLFLMVWWAWVNGVVYHDVHGNNDIKTRVMTFLQMMAVATMAVFAHSALGSGSIGYAISYGAFLLIITYLWWRTGVHDKDHRPLSVPYSLTYLVSTLLIVASVFVEPPLRFYIWGISLLLIIMLPLVLMIGAQRNESMRIQWDRATTVSKSLVERFGLITIIVLGEVIVGVVQGVAGQHHFTMGAGILGGLGMLIAIGIWWVYFDLVSSHQPRKGNLFEFSWIYLHLPLAICIAAAGAAVLKLIDYSSEEALSAAKLLLSGSVALAFLSITLIHKTIQIPEAFIYVHRLTGRVVFLSSLLVIVPAFIEMNTVIYLSITILIMLLPVVFGVRLWVRLEAGASGN